MVMKTKSCFTHFSVHLVISIQTLRNEDRTRNNDYEQDHLTNLLALHKTSIETY